MSKNQNISEQPFASAALVSLAIQSLRNQEPALLLPDAHEPDYLSDAKTTAERKSRIIAYAYDIGGAVPLLEVGRGLGEFLSMPALKVLLNSVNTRVLADKWVRLEKYHHSTHAVAIDHEQPLSWSCSRHWIGDDCPTDPENFLICGLQASILRLFGCRDLTGDIGGIQLPSDITSAQPVYPTADTHSWRFRWQASEECHNGDQTHNENGKIPYSSDAPDEIKKHLTGLFKQDVGRVWKLDETARSIGRSSRSLQRDIKSSGHTFSSLVRGTRCREASRLLTDSGMSLSAIGYWCGYSDQAHFQRDFRRAINMTPSTYRQVSKQQ
ncbi:MAG: AraC family transcriptional regulator [Oceanicoccus sp.]